jgi:hypothetical protein
MSEYVIAGGTRLTFIEWAERRKCDGLSEKKLEPHRRPIETCIKIGH